MMMGQINALFLGKALNWSIEGLFHMPPIVFSSRKLNTTCRVGSVDVIALPAALRERHDLAYTFAERELASAEFGALMAEHAEALRDGDRVTAGDRAP